MCAPCERVRKGSEEVTLARIIHEFRRGEFETEGHRRFLASKAERGVLADRRESRTRKARPGEESDAAASIYE